MARKTASVRPADQPCVNVKHEEFCISASRESGQGTYIRAYLSVYGGDNSNGRRVQASKLATRYADRIAFLRAERARLENSEIETPDHITSDMLSDLMQEVTDALVAASKAAIAVGASDVGEMLLKGIVTHAGRSVRAARRLEVPVTTNNDEAIELMSRAFIKFDYCKCAT